MRNVNVAIVALLALFQSAHAQVPAALSGPALQPEYMGATSLPDVVIDGNVARIHSQGLYVTERHFLVTGRLETTPKRALLLRFSRRPGGLVEFLDITPEKTDGQTLDHPGGFDRDALGRFQIPLSTSHRRGPTLVQGYQVPAARPLKDATLETTLRINDHLGAICCHPGTLLGANWDTKQIYFIDAKSGKVTKRLDQSGLLNRGKPTVAVQDWKSWPSSKQSANADASLQGQTILGGLVKGKRTEAIVQVVDLFADKVLQTHRFAMREDIARPVTNEGLAVYDGHLYLLPEDIGHGAKVLRYKLPTE